MNYEPIVIYKNYVEQFEKLFPDINNQLRNLSYDYPAMLTLYVDNLCIVKNVYSGAQNTYTYNERITMFSLLQLHIYM